MKKVLFIGLTVLLTSLGAVAQCGGKALILTGSKAEFLDERGNVQHTDDSKVVCRLDTQKVEFEHNDQPDETISGAVEKLSCQWTTPFRDGKTTFTSQLTDKSGDPRDAQVLIEGKDGKLTILLDLTAPDGRKMKIRVYVDSYEEKN
ncbi:MAG TPA: hypothetical protein VG870_11365 [Chitinophagaceae bacterium]|nr:hypothetical protein [Chitinophagaceae bacterium]